MKRLLAGVCLVPVLCMALYSEPAFVKNENTTIQIGMPMSTVTKILGKPFNIFEEKYSENYIHQIYVYRGIEIGCFKKHFNRNLENIVTDIRVDSSTYVDFLGNSVGEKIQSRQKSNQANTASYSYDLEHIPDPEKPYSGWKLASLEESGSSLFLRVNYHLTGRRVRIIMMSIIGDS